MKRPTVAAGIALVLQIDRQEDTLKRFVVELVVGLAAGGLIGGSVAASVWAVSYLVARHLVDGGFLSDVFVDLVAYTAAAGALTYVLVVCLPRWYRRRSS